MREALPAVVLLGVLLLLAWARPVADRQAPAALPPSGAETWMADAIPGVGPRSRDAVAAGIRRGQVPTAAREWFAH